MRSKLELKKISKQRPLRFTLKNKSKSTAHASKSIVTNQNKNLSNQIDRNLEARESRGKRGRRRKMKS